MLETGKDCLVCGQKKVLKEFKGSHPVCLTCDNERISDLVESQVELRSRRKDWGVAECKCGHFFERLKKNKEGKTVVFKECALCRARRDCAKTAKKAESITKETKNELRPETGLTMTQKSKEKSIKEGTTEKKQESKKPHIAPKTNKMSENTSENIMQETEKTSLTKYSSAENVVTQRLDSRTLFESLKEENSTSVQLLKDSTHRLIGYADKLSKPMMDSEQQVVIREQPVENTKEAVKCLEAARNMMKTQLEYMRFGRELAKDLSKK